MAERILITEPIVESVIADLRKDYSVDVGQRGQFSTEGDLIEAIAPYNALLTMLSNPVTKKVIQAGDNLKIIANHAVGYNNINLEAAKQAGVHVANTPGVLSESCADFTMGLILTVARRLKSAETFLRQGKFDGWDPLGFLGAELNDRTLGILGMGRIGTAVARRAKAFGLRIIYHNRSRVDSRLEQKLDATYIAELDELARQSDILSLHCPLTEDTRHSIDAAFIEQMPEHAMIINTARGPVIDEEALAKALHQNQLGGAALDVFEDEPTVHPQLLNAPNCVLTPHIASATHKTRRDIGNLAATAIRGILEGKRTQNIHNLLTV